MNDAAKAVLWATLGFAVGVAAVLVFRRDTVRHPSPAPAPAPSPTTSEIRREAPVTNHPEQTPATPPVVIPLPSLPKLGSPEGHTYLNPDRTTDSHVIRLGRPEKPYREDLVKLNSWDDFYIQAANAGLKDDQIEDLVFRRLKSELNVDDATIESVEGLFRAEQIAALKSIVDQLGGGKKFNEFVERPDALSSSTIEQWRSQRETVRATFQSEYLRYLTPDQLATLSRQLRNSQLVLDTINEGGKRYYYLGGFGNRAK